MDEDLTHGEFLLRLCTDEVERREHKQLDMRLRNRLRSETQTPTRGSDDGQSDGQWVSDQLGGATPAIRAELRKWRRERDSNSRYGATVRRF